MKETRFNSKPVNELKKYLDANKFDYKESTDYVDSKVSAKIIKVKEGDEELSIMHRKTSESYENDKFEIVKEGKLHENVSLNDVAKETSALRDRNLVKDNLSNLDQEINKATLKKDAIDKKEVKTKVEEIAL